MFQGQLTTLPFALHPVEATLSRGMPFAGPVYDSGTLTAPPTPEFRRKSQFQQIAAVFIAFAAILLVMLSMREGKIVVRGKRANATRVIQEFANRDETGERLLHYDDGELPVDTVAMFGPGEVGPMTLKVNSGERHFASHSGADVRVEGPALFGRIPWKWSPVQWIGACPIGEAGFFVLRVDVERASRRSGDGVSSCAD